jgi:hypothetical protein
MLESVLELQRLREIEATWTNDESMEKMQSNWRNFEKWCDQLGDRRDDVKRMVEYFSDRAAMAPASTRVDFHNAFPGGLLDHSLRVLRYSIELMSAFKMKASKESIIVTALFHDWGKLGTMEEEYYIRQDSDWHRQRGQFYIVNPKIRLSNAQQSLFNFSQFGIKLTEAEYLAILLNDGQYAEGNKQYAMKESALALIVHMADRWATQCEKSRLSLLEPDAPKF